MGCSREEDPVEWHTNEFCNNDFTEYRFPLPPAKRYDLNDDGIDDIEIFQEAMSVSTSDSDSRIVSQLSPLGVNQTMGLFWTSYMKTGDEITVDNPNWKKLNRAIMSVGGCRGLYKDKWTPKLGQDEHAFTAVKIFQKGIIYIVWIKVKRNFKTGEAQIVDHAFTTDSTIVVGMH